MTAQQTDKDALRERVRARYAAAATTVTSGDCGCGQPADCGCGDGCCTSGAATAEEPGFGAELYAQLDRDQLPDTALLASLGCGNPTAVAELHEGETVLDLGSGGGIDVLLSAKRVGPAGKAYGLDMTEEMLEIARANQREAGVDTAEFLKGTIEDVPLPDDSVDVVISNCVINLAADKRRVLSEAARVLRAGGRFAVSDVIADEDMDEATRADMDQWTGCVAGALTRSEYESALAAAGLVDVEIRETHRVHEHAGSAIIRARKP
jgi:arsenite methyltransferase